jgi:hypothetical protein
MDTVWVIPELDHITDGQIIVISFIRSERQLGIFSEKFKVPKELAYTYVKAVIDILAHNLAVYQGEYRVLLNQGKRSVETICH